MYLKCLDEDYLKDLQDPIRTLETGRELSVRSVVSWTQTKSCYSWNVDHTKEQSKINNCQYLHRLKHAIASSMVTACWVLTAKLVATRQSFIIKVNKSYILKHSLGIFFSLLAVYPKALVRLDCGQSAKFSLSPICYQDNISSLIYFSLCFGCKVDVSCSLNVSFTPYVILYLHSNTEPR